MTPSDSLHFWNGSKAYQKRTAAIVLSNPLKSLIERDDTSIDGRYLSFISKNIKEQAINSVTWCIMSRLWKNSAVLQEIC